MRSMQVQATQLQDATAAQLEAMRARSRTLRLRSSDLQTREQQLRELRMQTPAGPEREKVDQQWMNVRHDATAVSIELEGVTERIGELARQRDEARNDARYRRAVVQVPPPAPEPPPIEVGGLANVGIGMMILFVAPLLVVLVYRALTRGGAREPIGLDASPRLQRMEQTIESIAMDVERLIEGQRFTTRILVERHPDSAPRVQATPRPDSDTITPH
jgi:hypothetical protein